MPKIRETGKSLGAFRLMPLNPFILFCCGGKDQMFTPRATQTSHGEETVLSEQRGFYGHQPSRKRRAFVDTDRVTQVHGTMTALKIKDACVFHVEGGHRV